VTTTALADNPLLQNAQQAAQRVLAYLKTLPLDFWRNGVLFLSALWICHSLALLFWLLFPVPDLPQPTKFAAPVKASTQTAASAVQVDVASLQSQNLFGKLTEAPPPVTEEQTVAADLAVDENAATTKLNLQLHGVIASANPEEARAIIDTGKEQALYRVGEEIKNNNGVRLAKVMEQRVILDNKGRSESLWLYSEEDFKKTASNRKNRFNVPRNVQESRPPVNRSIRPSQIPKTISDVVRFSVHRENGAMIGYKVRPGRDRELFQQVGLKAGDVVTNVNGRQMNDPKQLREVYQELKTATEANLGVRRGDQELQITIRVDNTGG